jgi:hypothetical protein
MRKITKYLLRERVSLWLMVTSFNFFMWIRSVTCKRRNNALMKTILAIKSNWLLMAPSLFGSKHLEASSINRKVIVSTTMTRLFYKIKKQACFYM